VTSAHPLFTHTSAFNIRIIHPHFTRCNIRRSAHPHIRFLPIAPVTGKTSSFTTLLVLKRFIETVKVRFSSPNVKLNTNLNAVDRVHNAVFHDASRSASQHVRWHSTCRRQALIIAFVSCHSSSNAYAKLTTWHDVASLYASLLSRHFTVYFILTKLQTSFLSSNKQMITPNHVTWHQNRPKTINK